MPKLPQVNIRLPPEHHGLIRELAQRLRADPSLAVGLAQFLAQVSPGASPLGPSSAWPMVSPDSLGLADDVADLKERVDALEEREPRMVRIEALETRAAKLEEARDAEGLARQIAAHQRILPEILARIERLEGAAMSERPAIDQAPPGPRPVARPMSPGAKRRPPRPWTEADDATLRRIRNQGGTQADACREMDRSDGVISERWRKLEQQESALSVEAANEPPTSSSAS